LWFKQNYTCLFRPLISQSIRGVSVSALDVKRGDAIKRKGRVYIVKGTAHVNQGMRHGYLQADLEDFLKHTKQRERLRADEKVELADIETNKYLFTGKSNDGKFIFQRQNDPSDEKTFDEDFLGEVTVAYLQEDMLVTIQSLEEAVVSVVLPDKVTVEVEDAGERAKRESGSHKTVKLVNGRSIKAPSYIVNGEKIVIRTADESFMSRA